MCKQPFLPLTDEVTRKRREGTLPKVSKETALDLWSEGNVFACPGFRPACCTSCLPLTSHLKYSHAHIKSHLLYTPCCFSNRLGLFPPCPRWPVLVLLHQKQIPAWHPPPVEQREDRAWLKNLGESQLYLSLIGTGGHEECGGYYGHALCGHFKNSNALSKYKMLSVHSWLDFP